MLSISLCPDLDVCLAEEREDATLNAATDLLPPALVFGPSVHRFAGDYLKQQTRLWCKYQSQSKPAGVRINIDLNLRCRFAEGHGG